MMIRPDFGETRLDALQRHSFAYFLNETNPANGLVADRTQPGAPASIAAVGFALAAYTVGAHGRSAGARGFGARGVLGSTGHGPHRRRGQGVRYGGVNS